MTHTPALSRTRARLPLTFGVALLSLGAAVMPSAVHAAAPVAGDDIIESSQNGSGGTDVFRNDSDDDGDPIELVSFTQPEHGTSGIYSDGFGWYAPDADYLGADQFTYTISDGNGGTATATVYTMTHPDPTNSAPVARNNTRHVAKNDAVNVKVLRDDSDADGDRLRVLSKTAPDHGSAAIGRLDRVIRYSPDQGFVGTDSFRYTIGDGNGGQDTATVTVHVIPWRAGDDRGTLPASRERISLDVLRNDIAAAPAKVNVSIVDDARRGRVTVNNDRSVTYTSTGARTGTDTFAYRVCKTGTGVCDRGGVTVRLPAA